VSESQEIIVQQYAHPMLEGSMLKSTQFMHFVMTFDSGDILLGQGSGFINGFRYRKTYRFSVVDGQCPHRGCFRMQAYAFPLPFVYACSKCFWLEGAIGGRYGNTGVRITDAGVLSINDNLTIYGTSTLSESVSVGRLWKHRSYDRCCGCSEHC
jgi:hypothetical protein